MRQLTATLPGHLAGKAAERSIPDFVCAALGVDPGKDVSPEQLPFSPGDVTAGTENELATTVSGTARDVDFPRTLEAEKERQPARSSLDQWLGNANANVWDHSFIRVPLRELSNTALNRLHADVSHRSDRDRFFVHDEHGDRARLPASYVLRLALFDSMNALDEENAQLTRAVERISPVFFNDNTAPEVVSSYLATDETGSTLGREVARENGLRFLLVQALTCWANSKFGLTSTGQELQVFASPNPPERLKAFARTVPAEVYRRQLMNPCLSGFADAEGKASYMQLCHETLSRSKLASLGHLRRAGLGFPRTISQFPCETSLLNSGVHVSLGSRLLTNYARSGANGDAHEKWIGDLVSKIFEHFLPLFVGTFSAAPTRLPFSPLRPEQSLGFLPLELAPAQLRQTWWAWRRKAGLLGALHGDVVPDARLLDYFAALPSTDSHHAHDGTPGSQERLLATLEELGVYDRGMSFYDLYKLRRTAQIGFSGFEARFYSMFPRFFDDLAPAVDLQRLVTSAAWLAIAQGRVTHADTPDDPDSQSERRQMLFHAAIGLPFFYVHRASRNRFLLSIVETMQGIRVSKRFPSCYKVRIADYGVALCAWMRNESAATVEMLGAGSLLQDAAARVRGDFRADDRILAGIDGARESRGRDPASVNTSIETHLRTRLRERQASEAFGDATSALHRLDRDPHVGAVVKQVLAGETVSGILARAKATVTRSAAEAKGLPRFIALLVLHAEARHLRQAGA
jgi:hypothetical protein